MVGSAKAVLAFAEESIRARTDLPNVELSIMTFSRVPEENSFTAAVRKIGVPLDLVSERKRFDTRVIGQLRELVQKRATDIIWSNSVKSHFLVRWAGLNRSRGWVAFHHGYTATDLKMRIYNQLDRWSLRAADRVLTSSGAFINELERQSVGTNRIHIRHMPSLPFGHVTTDRKLELRRQLGLDDRTRILLSVGRLSREKGHADLIRALPQLRQLTGSTPVRLVVVGEGPERSSLEELRDTLGLNRHVALVGQQNDPSPYYAIADVFVLPSHSEGSPNVLLEAMAAGVPVVATAVGGVPEIATDGKDSLLVKKGEPAALAAAAAQLLGDEVLCRSLVSEARKVAARKSPDDYYRSIVSVLTEALPQ